jgi:small subunit ribosomal protein S20
MANHKSSIKRIRQTETKRLHNRYFAKTMRNALKEFRSIKEKEKAGEELPKLVAMIDKLSTKDVIHKNKAGNLKSGVVKFYNAMK